MERFCAYRERCPKEVRQKLKELGASDAISRQIFEVLQSDRFFDEERFAFAFASGKFRYNQWGRLRIRRELHFREINPDLIEAALANIDADEYAALLDKLADKKWQEYARDDNALPKAATSLIRAGFEPELVFKKLNSFKGYDAHSVP